MKVNYHCIQIQIGKREKFELELSKDDLIEQKSEWKSEKNLDLFEGICVSERILYKENFDEYIEREGIFSRYSILEESNVIENLIFLKIEEIMNMRRIYSSTHQGFSIARLKSMDGWFSRLEWNRKMWWDETI